MESLVTKLEREAELTYEQAVKAVECFRNYIVENDLEPDWDKFFRSKAQHLSQKAKQALNEISGKNQSWGDKLDDFTDKAKQTITEARSRAADFIAPKD